LKLNLRPSLKPNRKTSSALPRPGKNFGRRRRPRTTGASQPELSEEEAEARALAEAIEAERREFED
jgi:hypothetical protein